MADAPQQHEPADLDKMLVGISKQIEGLLRVRGTDFIVNAFIEVMCEDMARILISMIDREDLVQFVDKFQREHHRQISVVILKILKSNGIDESESNLRFFDVVRMKRMDSAFAREVTRAISGLDLSPIRDQIQVAGITYSRARFVKLINQKISHVSRKTLDPDSKWQWADEMPQDPEPDQTSN